MTRRECLQGVEQALTRIARVSHGREAARHRAERSGVFLSGPALRILACLRTSGRMRLSVLAHAADLEAPLVSREVRALIESGHVVRAADPTDGRAGIVQLTDRGRQASKAYRSATDEIIAETFAGWSSADLRALAQFVERVAADFARPSLASATPDRRRSQ